MMPMQRIRVAGRRFVLVPEADYERLCREANKRVDQGDLPPLPKPNKKGRLPAIEYARISLARDLIRERKALGLSQQRLAGLAGLRQETLSRLESGKHTASIRTVDRLSSALDRERRKRDGKK
jgi:DNA-binding XRE family transcriptional regulator